MLLAQFEAYYSRAYSPTRRVSLGVLQLPVDPPPGHGGVLLGGIIARYRRELDADLDEELDALVTELAAGARVRQPRLRHRLQSDQVGLRRCRHRLVRDGDDVRFVFDDGAGTPAQNVLCALYAAQSLEAAHRPAVFVAIAKAMAWPGGTDHRLIAHLSDRRSGGAARGAGVGIVGDPVAWALQVLDLRVGDGDRIARREVMRAYRDRLIGVHPDHGGDSNRAAEEIAALGEARRILLMSA